MKTGILVAGVVAAMAGSAYAQVLEESFDDPLGDWTQRWFYQNSNAENYYVARGSCDLNFRGNNPCGLWIADTQGCNTGVGGLTSEIVFDAPFAARIRSLAFDVRAFGATTVTVYDPAGGQIVQHVDVSNGVFPPCGGLHVVANSNTGVRRIRFERVSGTVEGNTAIDDVVVVFGNPCYADCDTSTGIGVLDIFDFLCFQNRYVEQDPYACDCDTNSGTGVCDVFDFLCFQSAFEAGCT